MRELIAKWRDEARGGDPGSTTALLRCARELEKAYHDDRHDGTWESDGSCPHCTAEMKAEGMEIAADAVEASINFQLLLLKNGAEIRGVL